MIILLLFFFKIIYLDLPVFGILRRQLRAAEEHIRNRSRAAEGRWSCDKWQQSTAGRTTSKVSITQIHVGRAVIVVVSRSSSVICCNI
jgi:hypothetical protein